ncbi:MAG: hypothetical protein ACJAYM_002614, partial [Flavobacteriales bacterium]
MQTATRPGLTQESQVSRDSKRPMRPASESRYGTTTQTRPNSSNQTTTRPNSGNSGNKWGTRPSSPSSGNSGTRPS